MCVRSPIDCSMPDSCAGSIALDFSILGRPFHAAGLGRALADWLTAHWDFREHVAPAHAHAITLHVSDGPVLGDGDPCEVTVQGTTLEFRSAGATWWLDAPDGGLRLTLAPSSSHIEVWGPDPYLGLYVAMTECLRASGLMPLHAAAIARDGAVTLLLGQSGTGKSTTVLRAALDGWTPLAEDTVWLDPASLFVAGWDRGVRLWPATKDRFAASLAGAPWRTDVDGKLVLDYRAFGDGAARSGTLARLVILAREADHESGWEPVASRDMVRAIWEATGVPLAADARELVARVIPSLLSRVECRRLWIGGAPLPL
jgi:hypothetical protein